MPYVEFRPRVAPAELVACTWARTVPRVGAPTFNRVLPDGSVDVVRRGNGEVFVAGPDSGPFMSPLVPGETIVGLRLRPGVAGLALGLPASELRDARVGLEELWGRSANELAERTAAIDRLDDARRALEDALLARLPGASGPDALVLAAIQRLGRRGSRVGSLADVLGSSERQLLRRFNAAVGYGPKTFDRVLRFQRFLAKAAEAARGEDQLAGIAAEVGYADQAHLTRECVRLSGLTPGRLAAVTGS